MQLCSVSTTGLQDHGKKRSASIRWGSFASLIRANHVCLERIRVSKDLPAVTLARLVRLSPQ